MSPRSFGRRILDPIYAAVQRLRGRVRRRRSCQNVQRSAAAIAAACRADGVRPAAILLLERLGDMVAASAIVSELRAQQPDQRFVWFGRARYRELALLVPGIDDFIAVECYGELADVVATLADWQVHDLNLNGKTCACCNQPWQNLAGSAGPDTEDYYDHGPLAQAFALAGGLPWRDREPALERPASSLATPSARPYAVVHSESEESARNWSSDGWRELVATLLAESDLDVVHVGVRPAGWLPDGPRVRDVAGSTDILDLIAIVQDAALFIGIDSSVAHIANATGRPGLILLGRYRRFLRYWPYSGFYGPEAGGAFVVRYPSECPYLPVSVGVRALRTVLQRRGATSSTEPRAGLRVGCGGPWDVRAQEVPLREAGPTVQQDSSCDVAVLAVLGAMRPADALRRWPGEPGEIILVLEGRAFAALANQEGSVDAAIAELETTGARFMFGQRPHGEEEIAFESPRYVRLDGRPVVLDESLPETLRILDVQEPVPATGLPALGAYWLRWDCENARDATVTLLHLRMVSESGNARAAVLPDGAIEADSTDYRAGVDEVRRGPAGDVERVSGWLVLASTGTPPAVVCLAERQADGRFRPRHLQPYSRLERPDVAQAEGDGAALFSGMRVDVPPDLQKLGPELAVLVLDRARGGWRQLRLPG